jgi:hypothetical protein
VDGSLIRLVPPVRPRFLNDLRVGVKGGTLVSDLETGTREVFAREVPAALSNSRRGLETSPTLTQTLTLTLG